MGNQIYKMSEEQKVSGIRYIKDPALEPYFIQLDDYCYAVQKTIVAAESGKEYQQNVGFYSTLTGCIKSIAKNEANSRCYESLQEYINQYEQIVSRLENALNL